MAKKVNKFLYLYVVQGKYTQEYGWEDLCSSEDYFESVSDLKAYRQNEREYPHRLIERRVLNPQYKKTVKA